MNTMPGNTMLSSVSMSAEYKLAVDNAEPAKQPLKVEDASVASTSANKPTAEQVDSALELVNKAAVFEQRSLSFMVDEASGRSIIKVMDKSTEQLIRQIPSEELLKVAQDIKRLQDEMGQSLGFLIDQQI